ncbi:hypothetical protein MTO96_013530 [Rhipicephalus appendiculatus]
MRVNRRHVDTVRTRTTLLEFRRHRSTRKVSGVEVVIDGEARAEEVFPAVSFFLNNFARRTRNETPTRREQRSLENSAHEAPAVRSSGDATARRCFGRLRNLLNI